MSFTTNQPAFTATWTRRLVTLAIASLLSTFAVSVSPAVAASPSSLDVAYGSNLGDTAVVITVGTGDLLAFDTVSVTIGGTPAIINASTSTTISLHTPAHAEGVVDVVITSSDINSISTPETLTGAFTYQSACYSTDPLGVLTDGHMCTGALVIDNTVTSIAANAFSKKDGNVIYYSPITSLIVGTGVTEIGINAFKGSYLQSVIIPGNVKTIGGGAFLENMQLSSVTLSEGLETIGALAFYGYLKFTSITIPSSVITIGAEAFGGNSPLTTMRIGTVANPSLLVNFAPNAVSLKPSEPTADFNKLFFCNTPGTTISLTDNRVSPITNIDSVCPIPDSPINIDSATAGVTSVVLNIIPGADYGDSITNYEWTIDNPIGDYVWKALSPAQTGSTITISDPSLVVGVPVVVLLRAVNATGVSTSFTPSPTFTPLVESHHVTYDAGGGIGSVPLQSDVDSGTSFTVAPITGVEKLSYSFDGWSDGISISKIMPTDLYPVTTSDVVLTATWTANPRPTISSSLGAFTPATGSDSTFSWMDVVSTSDGITRYAVVFGGGIYKSTDSGRTWAILPGQIDRNWWDISVSANGQRISAIVWNGHGWSPGTIWNSTDGGATWIESLENPPFNLSHIVTSADGLQVYVSADSGLHRSIDGGAHFTALNVAVFQAGVYLISTSADGQKLFASVGKSIFNSIDGGETWIDHGSAIAFSGCCGFAAIWSSADGMTLLGADDGGAGHLPVLYKSIDGGVNWASIPTAPTFGQDVWPFMITASNDAQKIMYGPDGGSLYISLDSGLTWTEAVSQNAYSSWNGGVVLDNSNYISVAMGDWSSPSNGPVPYGNIYTSTLSAALSVITGLASGGTSLTISGTNFVDGLTVTFGDAAATNVVVNSATSITVTTPAHAAGLVDVTVTNPDTGSGTLTGAFTYTAVVTPPSAPVSTYVEPVVPVASETSPLVVPVVDANGATISAQLQRASGTANQAVTILVPVNATKENVTFTLAPVSNGADATAGFNVLKLSAATTVGATAVTSFDKPLSITIPAGASGALPAWSVDGFSWTAMTKLTSPTLPDGVADGYYINADGSYLLLTRHLTLFGFRKAQSALVLTAADAIVQLSKSTQLSTTGGSGDGSLVYSSSSSMTCSVSELGLVSAVAAGTCKVKAQKLGAGIYLDSSNELSLTISDSDAVAKAAADEKALADAKAAADQAKAEADAKAALDAKAAELALAEQVKLDAAKAATRAIAAAWKKALAVTSTSARATTMSINLSSAFKGRIVTIEMYTKVKGKTVEKALAKVKLNSSGDAKYVAKKLKAKGATFKLKYGTKYIGGTKI
ncbi:unannotated protein [freshwater metagenome]|uniref:Unannotated protein n=1 Tax=freshwater metagenome TaxID=449393 RepID=A0A6J7LWY0_9ZZZZ|nr:leucine-rich repeat protein [Actinomycetota bacterium]MSX62080.1 leucine-rich repeat protein [Actinomycetota bacterium]